MDSFESNLAKPDFNRRLLATEVWGFLYTVVARMMVKTFCQGQASPFTVLYGEMHVTTSI